MGITFARPESVKLPLADGAWILVRRRLSAGEQREHFARLVKHTDTTGRLELNVRQIGISTIVAYLLDWSASDTFPIRGLAPEDLAVAVDQLESDSYNEILAAITAHEQAMQAARAEEKKTPGWRERIVTDLAIARAMHWRYEEVGALDVDVYAVLVEELAREARELEKAAR